MGSFISSKHRTYTTGQLSHCDFAYRSQIRGLGTTSLGWVLCSILLAAAIWLFYLRPRQNGAALGATTVANDQQVESVATDLSS